MVDVNVINPFLEATISTLEMVAQIKLTVGKPFLRENLDFNDENVLTIVGITGAMKGRVIMALPATNAKNVASNMMMGMPVDELNEMALSALSELGNMTMGTAATIFSTKNVLIDITPPMIQHGTVKMETFNSQMICVPMLKDGTDFMEINIILKTNN